MNLPPYFRSLSPEAGLALVKRACESKVRHQTLKAAEWTANDRRNQGLEAYRCKFCDGWHVGHRKVREQ